MAPESSNPLARLIGWMLVFSVVLALLAGLSALLVAIFGPQSLALVGVVAILLFVVPLFHYVIWGWWMGKWIRQQDARYEALAAENAADETSESPPV